ncbi:hypothetical protein [Streptomyces sp. NPDC059753]|uniref:hypothetical protein n=1 Tax=Streptomyces sp. NPDC059753 TaxID=3346933 RepID=UPI0036504FEC
MTGPEHYTEAEDLLAQVKDNGYGDGSYTADLLAAAQIHATLAHAAAMGAPVDGEGDSGLPPRDCSEWYRVAGVKPRKDADA